jgi:hypothetical protein
MRRRDFDRRWRDYSPATSYSDPARDPENMPWAHSHDWILSGSQYHAHGGSPTLAVILFHFTAQAWKARSSYRFSHHWEPNRWAWTREAFGNMKLSHRLWRYPRSALTNHHELSPSLGSGTLGRRWTTQWRKGGMENDPGQSRSLRTGIKRRGTWAHERQMGKHHPCISDRASEKFCLVPCSIDPQPMTGLHGVGAMGMPIGQDQQVSDIETD